MLSLQITSDEVVFAVMSKYTNATKSNESALRDSDGFYICNGFYFVV